MQTPQVLFAPFLRPLVAPYRAMPRDYLSDTPLLRAMGFLVSQHGQLGAIPPPPFLSIPPWRACEVKVRYPPPQKWYLSDTCAIPYENKANGCDTPLCDTISKGYCAIWGGISHWAAKFLPLQVALGAHIAYGPGAYQQPEVSLQKRRHCQLLQLLGHVSLTASFFRGPVIEHKIRKTPSSLEIRKEKSEKITKSPLRVEPRKD